MKCVEPNEMYFHRGQILMRYHKEEDGNDGIGTDEDDALFATFADARRYVDKRIDGTNDREPVIIGRWKMPEKYLVGVR